MASYRIEVTEDAKVDLSYYTAFDNSSCPKFASNSRNSHWLKPRTASLYGIRH